MRKFAILLLVSASLSIPATKSATVESCNRDVCSTYELRDVKKADVKKDPNGRRFVRVTFPDGSLLDIGGDSVYVRK